VHKPSTAAEFLKPKPDLQVLQTNQTKPKQKQPGAYHQGNGQVKWDLTCDMLPRGKGDFKDSAEEGHTPETEHKDRKATLFKVLHQRGA
jgi:hypothetical protein